MFFENKEFYDIWGHRGCDLWVLREQKSVMTVNPPSSCSNVTNHVTDTWPQSGCGKESPMIKYCPLKTNIRQISGIFRIKYRSLMLIFPGINQRFLRGISWLSYFFFSSFTNWCIFLPYRTSPDSADFFLHSITLASSTQSHNPSYSLNEFPLKAFLRSPYILNII